MATQNVITGKGAAKGAPLAAPPASRRDIGFAIGIVGILSVLFLPIPAFVIDLGLAFSIALSVLILMVSLWMYPSAVSRLYRLVSMADDVPMIGA